MKLIGALKAAKRTAPFYSAVDETLANLKRNKGTGSEFLTEVMKTKGVKPAEIADRKLEQAFKNKGKMTKGEAQQILKENPPPNLKEKVYDESTAIDEDDLREMVSQEMFDKPYSAISFGSAQHRKISDEVYKRMEADNGTKFGKFKTEGGENYREILLRLPKTRPDASNYTDPAKYDADLRAYNASGQSDYYHPNHFSDDANIVAHMRVQDRMIPQPPQKGFYVVNKTSGRQSDMFDTPEQLQAYVETLPESIRNNVTMAQGERKVPPRKVLQVEEIQSDWHQAGRKKGYATPETKRLKGTVEEQKSDFGFAPEYQVVWEDGTFSGGYGSREQAQARAAEGKSDAKVGVPDAPFKKNWRELAMKRLLNYAADNDYDSIAITPGVEQAKFYDLSKQLSEVVFDPATGYLSGRDPQGKMVVAQQGVTKETLPDYIGKEGAQKILEASPDASGNLALRGVDLQVGGESLKDLYDNIIPNYLNTFGKPYGAQVGQIGIRDPNAPSSPSRYAIVRDADNNFRLQDTQTEQFALPEIYKSSAEAESAIDDKINRSLKLHNFPITPEMRESIKQKGLPLYQQVGIPTAGAGAASQMLEPEEEAGLATGGVVKSAVKQAQLAKLAKMREQMAPRAEAVKALIARDQNRYLADVAPNSLTNAEIESEIKRMAAKAPMFMKPSALTELKKTVQQEKGGYGSRRLERAADEIPNLERLYKEQALKEAFTGDNARALMTMNPKDFGKYAMPLDSREHYGYESQSEYIDKLAKLVGGFNDVPFLEINKREQGAPKIPFISGHEGRHRSRALESNAEPASLVRLLPRSELREPFPRRSQEEYIDALKKELEITGNKVIPEKYFDNFKQEELKRPPIILPDIYAKGGAVKPKVKDAKSGKVTMTKNRDTMFMELSNKKLKRK